MNAAATGSLTGVAERSVWYRAADPRYLATLLNTFHTIGIRSRFSPGALASAPFETLYLAENPVVALFEVQSLLGSPVTPGGLVAHPKRSFVTVAVNVSLNHIADLTDVAAQKLLHTSAQELTGDWQGYALRSALTTVSAPTGVAPTQDLGEALYKAGFEGFRTLSARVPYHEALVVFPQKLRAGSSISFSYRDGAGAQHTVSLP